MRRVVDAVGCALAAIDAEPCVRVRELASAVTSGPSASVIGSRHRTTPEFATFANAAMVRYLDFNDSYPTEGGGHPSDLIPAILAAAELREASGRQFVDGVHVAYEVFAALADAVPMRRYGFDYGAFLGIAAAAGAARVFELVAPAVAHAVAIAITPSLPLLAARSGELSHWKGFASAHAAMTGIFAARLAAVGIHGPERPFDGKDGLFEVVTGAFTLADVGAPVRGLSAAERTHVKLVPAEGLVQGIVEKLIELRAGGLRADRIAAVRVVTYEILWLITGGGQGDREQKWDPRRRETADHSLPYLAAVALVDGAVTRESFADGRMRDPALRELMARIEVVSDPEFSRDWVSNPRHRIEISLDDGARRSVDVGPARGHPRNPVTDEEIRTKFLDNSVTAVEAHAADALLESLWHIEDMDSVREMTPALRSARAVGVR